jgi:hypothetical protein
MRICSHNPLLGGPLLRWRQARRERRYAHTCCQALLALHQRALASQPGLAGLALYRQVVADHMGADGSAADAVLQAAQQSYAEWPVDRALNFRDVAHYLAVSGFWAHERGGHAIHANIREVVEASIPQHW